MGRVQFINRRGPDPAGRTVIVLGCGRGGTSAMAGALRAMDVAFQPDSHPLKHEGSPVVYCGGEVDRRATASNLRDMDARVTLWGWKSPRDLFSVHSWVSMVRNPMFVCIWRGQMQTTRSVVTREGLDFEVALRHISEVYAELGRFVFTTPFPVANVDYVELCASPRAVLSEVADWLDHPLQEDQLATATRFLLAGNGQYVVFGSASVLFSPEEIAADQVASHAALYGQAIADLKTATRTLDEDIGTAETLVAELCRNLGYGVGADFHPEQLELDASAPGPVADYRLARGLFIARSNHRALLQREIDALVTSQSSEP